jgi:hypothetical protein
MDPRLRTAVDASIGWYEDLCALHGVGSVLADGLWSALGAPPPLHSDAVVVEPAVTAGWAPVTSPTELNAWTGNHDTADVLLPPLLHRAHFRILARYVDGRIVAGAVARLGSGIVDVSNVYAVGGYHVDWAELAEVIGGYFPGRPLVGYERGEALTAARAGGFVPAGDLRVWCR